MRLTKPAHRHARYHAGDVVMRGFIITLTGDRAGGDSIGSDALGAEFLRQSLGQPPKPVLRNRNRRAAIIAMYGIHAEQVHNPPPAAIQHPRQAGARQPHAGIKINRNHAAPIRIAHFQEAPIGAKGCIIHQHIHCAEACNRVTRDARAFIGHANIGHGYQSLHAKGAGLSGNVFASIAIAGSIDDDVEAHARQIKRDGAANIAAGASD